MSNTKINLNDKTLSLINDLGNYFQETSAENVIIKSINLLKFVRDSETNGNFVGILDKDNQFHRILLNTKQKL